MQAGYDILSQRQPDLKNQKNLHEPLVGNTNGLVGSQTSFLWGHQCRAQTTGPITPQPCEDGNQVMNLLCIWH